MKLKGDAPVFVYKSHDVWDNTYWLQTQSEGNFLNLTRSEKNFYVHFLTTICPLFICYFQTTSNTLNKPQV